MPEAKKEPKKEVKEKTEKSFSIEKPDAVTTELFLSELPRGATMRRMFGCHAGFVNGNMMGGTWGNSVMLRLSPAHAEEARAAGARVFDPMGGRPMKDYLVLPAPLVATQDGMRMWLARAASFTGMMPIKLPKPRKNKKL